MQSAVFGRLCRLPATARAVARRSTSFLSTSTKMAMASRAPSNNAWRSLAARNFATAAAPQTSAAQPAPQLPVKVETITTTLPEEQITQESMLVPLADLVPIPDSFAVVHVGGKQWKVTKDDTIMVEKLDVPVQTKIILDKVLLFGTQQMTALGQPMLTNVKVLAEVEEQALAGKVLVFKKKRRHGYKRFKGHRQPYTLLRIVDVLAKKD